jgi:5'-3' exonuclease
MTEISVKFSPVGTAQSTVTCLRSLINQIPEVAGKVVAVDFRDYRLTIRLDGNGGTDNYHIELDGKRFILPIMDLTANGLAGALRDLANAIFSRQIAEGAILEVKSIGMSDMNFSIELKRSDFQNNRSAERQTQKHELTPDSLMATNNRLLLIDASNLISACYYATAHGKEEHELMKSSKGIYTNAIKALIERFISLVRLYAPTHVAIAGDDDRENLMRRVLYTNYKKNRDNREKPQALVAQIPLAFQLFEAMNLPVFKVDRMEADDVIGHFAKRFVQENRGDVIVVSNDSDLYQLLNGKVTQVLSGNVEMTRESFMDKYKGITPEQFVDFKALCGDEADNIPGIPGVGEKTAIKLLKEFSSLDELLLKTDVVKGRLREKIKEHAEDLGVFRQLATLYTDLPALQNIHFDALRMNVDKNGMRHFLEDLEINIFRSSVA